LLELVIKMQYKYNNPQSGDQRSISKFLLFPKTLRVGNTNHYETRWFRKCKIIQTYREKRWYEEFGTFCDENYLYSTWHWCDVCWAE